MNYRTKGHQDMAVPKKTYFERSFYQNQTFAPNPKRIQKPFNPMALSKNIVVLLKALKKIHVTNIAK